MTDVGDSVLTVSQGENGGDFSVRVRCAGRVQRYFP
jgi:hypothetical protein